MRANPSRTALAAVMTIVVVSLLTLAASSNDRTRGYYPFSIDKLDMSTDGDRLDFTQEAADDTHIKLPDFPTRVRATLQMGREDAPTVTIPVHHPTEHGDIERLDELRTTPPLPGRQGALEFSAILFALFGLFVLWWGRDRASLWLGLFCASFAPPIFDHYCVLPEWGMLLAGIVADLLFFLSIYAFFEIAQTFALEAMNPTDPLRRQIEFVRESLLTIVLFAAAVNFATNVAPTVFGESVWEWVVNLGTYAKELAIVSALGVGPIALLGIGWWRAMSEGARKRVRITLITTLAAESGVLVAMSQQLVDRRPLGFGDSWFTLLAIPIGFLFSIPAYKVVEVKFVLNRILVLTTMTAIVGGIIVLSETWADTTMKEPVGNYILQRLGKTTPADKDNFAAALRFTVAFTIVLAFSRCHHILDEFFKALFFRRRDEALKSLHDFAANRAPFITVREEMLQQAIALICRSLGARGSAFYEESGAGYELASICGDIAWPGSAGENDPAFTLLRGGRDRVDLATLDPTPSVLGPEGVAIRMAVCNRVIGSLVVGTRAKESEGPYEREELEVLEDVARSVADALFNLRANETADFVRRVADGSLRGNDAMQKAETLCDHGLPGVDTSLRRRATKPSSLPQILALRSPAPRDDAARAPWLSSIESEPRPSE